MTREIRDNNFVEYQFLRISAERFASDLQQFSRGIYQFSDEQLYAIVSFCDHIRDNMAVVKKELERRVSR